MSVPAQSDKNQGRTSIQRSKAQKRVSDAIMALVEAITDLEVVVESESYQRGFDDGVQHLQNEFKNLVKGGEDTVEPIPTRPYILTEIDRIMQDSVISHVTDTPGLRTIDITNKLVALPVKPALTEKAIRLTINRLKNTGKIEDKAGRWYLAGAKPPTTAYQVMTYLPDGSKYLGADILK